MRGVWRTVAGSDLPRRHSQLHPTMQQTPSPASRLTARLIWRVTLDSFGHRDLGGGRQVGGASICGPVRGAYSEAVGVGRSGAAYPAALFADSDLCPRVV